MIYVIPGSENTFTAMSTFPDEFTQSPSPRRRHSKDSSTHPSSNRNKLSIRSLLDSESEVTTVSPAMESPVIEETGRNTTFVRRLKLRIPWDKTLPAQEEPKTKGRVLRQQSSGTEITSTGRRRKSQRLSNSTVTNGKLESIEDVKNMDMEKKLSSPTRERESRNPSPTKRTSPTKNLSNKNSSPSRVHSSPRKEFTPVATTVTTATINNTTTKLTKPPNKIRIVLRPSTETSPNATSPQLSSPTGKDNLSPGKKARSRQGKLVEADTPSPALLRGNAKRSNHKHKKTKTTINTSTKRTKSALLGPKLTSSPEKSKRVTKQKPSRIINESLNESNNIGDNDHVITDSSSNVKKPTRRYKKTPIQVKDMATEEIKVEALPPEQNEFPIINNEFCSACSGTGSLICCETCPKSFHFLCADPPIDPDRIPDDAWYCNECWARRNRPFRKPKLLPTVHDIWERLVEHISRTNPKVFTVPKRIRKIAQEQELKLLSKPSIIRQIKLIAPGERSQTRRVSMAAITMVEEEHQADGLAQVAPSELRQRLALDGFCHYCNKGAGTELVQKLIRCDRCTLLWHLDCLPYPQTVYPSSHRQWLCPLHFTDEALSDLNLSPTTTCHLRQVAERTLVHIEDWPQSHSISILPESSIRLNFGLKLGSVKSSQRRGCSVPDEVKHAYHSVLSLPTGEVERLQLYNHRRYVDSSIETDPV